MQNKRKRHFIDRTVQGAILRRLAMHWFLSLALMGGLLYFVELLLVEPQNAWGNLVERHAATVLVICALAPIFLYDLCVLTNRFAGPMVRLRRAMKSLADGEDVAEVRFREQDYWGDLAEDFNRVLRRLRSAEASSSERCEAQFLEPQLEEV